ncbi:glycosyltransferase family 4 protein [Roseovarius sp. EGI FJ00037]|uniref:glycosyltransferase family 4 protein n=1 Tax=Roseovarius TaxID=74030 RepID=UPI0022A704F8|nr:glycosyltransferase family 4 protein [Roseovarius sp. EGI FJ00037]MCZ0811249.1 glycosyltransferase family 4 protein [Roseovarius sp. EGI FJ00037]
MRIGYLMNAYPMTSTTFIRREIHALESSGVSIARYAIRPWSEPLVDDQDKAEQHKTFYLLVGRLPALLADFAAETLANPKGLWRALRGWWRLWRNAGGGLVPHVAYLLEAVSLKRRAMRDRITHLHTHFSTNSAAVAMLCHRLGGPGYSFTAHGPDEFVYWGRSSLALKVSEARFVVAISEYCRVQLARAAGMAHWDKIQIVRCGIDLSEFAPSNAPSDAKAPFVTVGRLCPQKAQTLIVEAAAQVVARHPDLRIVLIGDGETRGAIEAAIARHGLQGNLTLLGWRDNAEVRRHLEAARALLLPSFAEGLPVVIMEALALGRPAISTYIAGIPELVDDSCGWIIPAGSIDAIAAAMDDALDAPPETLARKGAEGRRRIQAQHDVNKNARQLKALFNANEGNPANGKPSPDCRDALKEPAQ